jgi:DGQHR domain-containing protein
MAKVAQAIIAENFEEAVRKLLRICRFEDVGGGRGFVLGDQVDAVAGHEDTLLVVECKTGPRDGRPILDDIRIVRGKIAKINEACQADPRYGKYSERRYIVATNFPIRPNDYAEADGNPRVYLWDRTFLEYYASMVERIGPFTRFNLLGELGVAPRVERVINVPAFRTNLPDGKVYLFYIDPLELLKWSYVARREVGKEKFYQRLVERGRLNKIRQFIDSGRYFANAPIIAFNSPPVYKPFPETKEHFGVWDPRLEFGSLSFPATYRTCWIVDGQHRLYGMSKSAHTEPLLPVVGLEDLDVAKQAQLFLEINKFQKPVPSDLVWDLEGEMNPKSQDGVIARVAKRINESGPLRDKIYIPLSGPKQRGQLKLSGLCSAIKKRKLTSQVLEHDIGNPLFDPDPDALVRRVGASLSTALFAAAEAFPEWQRDGFWFQNSGLAIFVALVEQILCYRHSSPDKAEFSSFLHHASDHADRYKGQVQALRQRCNSEGGRDEVAAEFVRAIRSGVEDDRFGEGIPDSDLEKRIKRVERDLADTVAKVLGGRTPNWFKERVPEGVRNRVRDLMQKERQVGGRVQDFLSFGETKEIVTRADNWRDLEGTFVVRNGFSDLAELEHGFTHINKLRGRVAHGRAEIDEPDLNLLQGFLAKFEGVVKGSAKPTQPVP